jgi:hypothetical protein
MAQSPPRTKLSKKECFLKFQTGLKDVSGLGDVCIASSGLETLEHRQQGGLAVTLPTPAVLGVLAPLQPREARLRLLWGRTRSTGTWLTVRSSLCH